MTLSGGNVMFVGPGFHDTQVLTGKLLQWGFQCHFANGLLSARELFKTTEVNLILSNVYLPDGTGFGLLADLSGVPVTAFLCLPLEEGCFWLPAIDQGKVCLGLAALRPAEFVSALEQMSKFEALAEN